MISPNGVMSNSVKYILGLCFIITLIGGTGIKIKKEDMNFPSKSETVIDNTALQTANAEFVYSYALKSAGVEFSEITVCTDKAEDGSIIITKVIIKSDCEKEKILSVLKEPSQVYEVEIINE